MWSLPCQRSGQGLGQAIGRATGIAHSRTPTPATRQGKMAVDSGTDPSPLSTQPSSQLVFFSYVQPRWRQ
jgi:hypothetical protein